MKTVIGATLAGALVIGAGAYVLGAKPAESEVLPQTPASASVQAQASEPAAAPQHKPRTREQAAEALMALPELKAWSAMVEKNSGGQSHGALIEYDPAPRTIKGKTYYQFSFVENTPEAALRWESFLASVSDDEILVEDSSTDELLTLERWRKEKQPAKRTGIDG
jgi:hypothetical protein